MCPNDDKLDDKYYYYLYATGGTNALMILYVREDLSIFV